MLFSLVYQESCREHRVSNLLGFWTAMVHCKIITPFPLSLSWKKNVGIISFLLKHMALTTSNGKQRHEIITKCRTLWAQIEMKKRNGMQIVNMANQLPLCHLFQCPPLPPCSGKIWGKTNQPEFPNLTQSRASSQQKARSFCVYKRSTGKRFNNDKVISKLLKGTEGLRRA